MNFRYSTREDNGEQRQINMSWRTQTCFIITFSVLSQSSCACLKMEAVKIFSLNTCSDCILRSLKVALWRLPLKNVLQHKLIQLENAQFNINQWAFDIYMIQSTSQWQFYIIIYFCQQLNCIPHNSVSVTLWQTLMETKYSYLIKKRLNHN